MRIGCACVSMVHIPPAQRGKIGAYSSFCGSFDRSKAQKSVVADSGPKAMKLHFPLPFPNHNRNSQQNTHQEYQ
jgi:hypothetical protein